MIEKLPNQLFVMFCNGLFQLAVLSGVWSILYIFCFASENRESGVRIFTELLSECKR